ncbi:Sodium:sulfate symporter transmembrane region-domain-containing protein [Ochromonadaceae sp. CCMP2298]|nr:Sodium:sulfate symporter transmembrane region-domain-containing protein [Ochromonadaceae sp. CCMP2298]
MKFGKQLQLGIYDPWKDYYIQYNRLKRIIQRKQFVIEKYSLDAESAQSTGEGRKAEVGKGKKLAAVAEATEDTPLIASPSKSELAAAEEEFFPMIDEEILRINKFFVGKVAELRVALDLINSTRSNTYLSHHTSLDPSILLRLRSVYVQLMALKSYCELNKTGFVKIIKKYDKALGEETQKQWKSTIEQQPFALTSEPMHLIDIVTGLVSRAKLMEWDRFATEQRSGSDLLFPAVRWGGLLFSAALFTISLFLPPFELANDPANRCLSLLLFTISLWVTEAIPYYSTATLIPAMVVLLQVLRDPHSGGIMPVKMAAEFVTNHIFNHTTLLLLGGYTISTAFSRCQLELRLAALMQQYLGNNPPLFILAVMFLGLFLSMWISNHTAPILCSAIIMPVIRDLPTDSRFSKTLLLGLAYACNFGGMMTPISSVQNLLATSYLEQTGIEVSFGRWILVSLPFCTVANIIAWLFLLVVMEPYDIKSIPIIVYERGNVLGKKNIAVLVLSLATITTFACFNIVEDIFGDIGIVACIFIGIIFGSGILTEVDFNSLSWHTLFLVGGGNVLGKAVTSSGLLAVISDNIIHALPLQQPWMATAIIVGFSMTIATFVSHTVAALVLFPLISTIGVKLGMPEIAVMGSAFAVSAAMALPFSSFPNVNSVLILDDFQRPYLSVKDFIVTGLPLSMISLLLILTLGFLLISVIIV